VRLRRGRRLSGAGGRPFRRATEDPLAGVANLADVMLVFACGLLVALVLAWDMRSALDPSLRERLRAQAALRAARQVDSLRRADGEAEESLAGEAGGRYRSVGRVYRDTITGKMFIVDAPR